MHVFRVSLVLWIVVGFEAGAQDPTYYGDVAAILQANCVECHRQGGIAPFALETYEQAAGRAAMIGYVVEEGVMPPWFAAPPEHGGPSPWANDRSLPPEERQTLLNWVSSTRAKGDPDDGPQPREFRSDWWIGEPDVIYELPQDVAIKAEGTMPYVNLRVETNLTEDRWVRAIQIKPTAREVVHHALVFAFPPTEPGERPRRADGDDYFAAYVPGNDGVVYPEGFARRLPAGSMLAFQLHYTPNGTETHDRTQIAMVFADSEPEHQVRTTGIANRNIEIPAGADNHREQATLRVPGEAHITAFLPHMHVRGKAFRYELERPGEDRQLLLDVPRYDFNWQLRYELKEPLVVPAGSVLTTTAWYDNSPNNPANPDPTETVRWGPQTYHEMMLGYVEYYVPNSSGARALRRSAADLIMNRFDTNGDGVITREECPDRLTRQFDRLDADGDGVLTREEVDEGAG